MARKRRQTEQEKILKDPAVKESLDIIKQEISAPPNTILSTPSTSGSGSESKRSEREIQLEEEIAQLNKQKYDLGHAIQPEDVTNLTAEELELKRREVNVRKAEVKKRIVEAYEEKMVLSLDRVAELQQKILMLGIDESKIVTQEYLERMKLAMKGAEQILNRSIGKPTTRIESTIQSNVAEEMARIHDDWVVEAEEEE